MAIVLLSREPGLVRLECQTELTAATLDTGRPRLDRIIEPGWYAGHLILGLGRADYIDSSGIGWLVCLHKRCREAGGRLILHSLSPMAHHAFKLLDLYGVLNEANNEREALELAGVVSERQA